MLQHDLLDGGEVSVAQALEACGGSNSLFGLGRFQWMLLVSTPPPPPIPSSDRSVTHIGILLRSTLSTCAMQGGGRALSVDVAGECGLQSSFVDFGNCLHYTRRETR